MSNPLPAVFLGHGTPMNALWHNRFTEGWSALGKSLPRPKAVLSISAHWYTYGSALTINTAPKTIHDFGGFPKELFDMRYPAPGDPDLARRVHVLLAPLQTDLTQDWGLDHGTWSVLHHVYPHADVPVVQLSIDGTRPAQFHFDIGRRLAPLREEGVLILGSGNLVHNLRAYARGEAIPPFKWASAFESRARQLLLAGSHKELIGYENLGFEASLAVPTPDHYFPLLYTLGAGVKGEPLSFPVEGFDGGSMSMLAVRLG
jgi:4,5-DOPA dioxygenase extradiol